MTVPVVLADPPGPGPGAVALPSPRALWRPVLGVLAGLGVLGLLAHRSGGVAAAVRATQGAGTAWLLLAAAIGSGSYLCAAVVQHGAVGRAVPLPRLLVVQLACAFTNRLLPGGVGAMATNLRGFGRAGVGPARARLGVGAAAASSVLVHVVLSAAALPYVLADGPLRRHLVPHGVAVLAVPVALGVAVLLLLRGPALARALGRRLDLEAGQLRRLAGCPADLGLLVGGSAGTTACHAAAFVAALHAVGLTLPLPTSLSLYVVAVAVAGLVPAPGGAGGVDAALLLALGAAGAAAPAAAAAVLVFRLVTFWLPVLPGVAALLWSVRRGWL